MSDHYPTQYPAPRQRGNLLLGTIAGVIVGAIAVMFVWFAFVDDPDTATPGPTPTPTPVESAQAPDPSPTPDESPAASPTPEETPATSPSPSPSPSAAPTGNPAVLTELAPGWVTVLDSLDKTSVSADEAVARAVELTRPGYPAHALDTDAFRGLTPGYWAIVIPGATSGDGALAVCTEIGLTPRSNNCYARQIQG